MATVGKEYVVEMITCYAGKSAELSIRGDHDRPNQVPADRFETIDGRLPSNWVAAIDEDGHLQIGPESWLRPDFWLDYFGSEGSTHEQTLQAIDEYRRERDVILREST